jgi:hypothetical protein
MNIVGAAVGSGGTALRSRHAPCRQCAPTDCQYVEVRSLRSLDPVSPLVNIVDRVTCQLRIVEEHPPLFRQPILREAKFGGKRFVKFDQPVSHAFHLDALQWFPCELLSCRRYRCELSCSRFGKAPFRQN